MISAGLLLSSAVPPWTLLPLDAGELLPDNAPLALPAENPHAPLESPLPLPTLLSYAPPVIGLSAPLFLVQFYFLNYATDVLLLAPLGVGLLFAAGRAWDAISDPIVGTFSDRTRTRLGRRRPWMFAGIPLLMVTLAMIWAPPDLSPSLLYVWLAVALFGFYTAFTMYAVPHAALGAELSRNHHERSRIFGAQAAAFTLGMMLSFGGMQWVSNATAPREAASTPGVRVDRRAAPDPSHPSAPNPRAGRPSGARCLELVAGHARRSCQSPRAPALGRPIHPDDRLRRAGDHGSLPDAICDEAPRPDRGRCRRSSSSSP